MSLPARSADDLVAALGVASGISKSAVSRICAGLDAEVSRFRDRTLTPTTFPYVYLDATYCNVRVRAHLVGSDAHSGLNAAVVQQFTRASWGPVGNRDGRKRFSGRPGYHGADGLEEAAQSFGRPRSLLRFPWVRGQVFERPESSAPPAQSWGERWHFSKVMNIHITLERCAA